MPNPPVDVGRAHVATRNVHGAHHIIAEALQTLLVSAQARRPCRGRRPLAASSLCPSAPARRAPRAQVTPSARRRAAPALGVEMVAAPPAVSIGAGDGAGSGSGAIGASEHRALVAPCVDGRRGGRAARTHRVGARAGGRGDCPVAGSSRSAATASARSTSPRPRNFRPRRPPPSPCCSRGAPGRLARGPSPLLPPGALLPRFAWLLRRGLRRAWCRRGASTGTGSDSGAAGSSSASDRRWPPTRRRTAPPPSAKQGGFGRRRLDSASDSAGAGGARRGEGARRVRCRRRASGRSSEGCTRLSVSSSVCGSRGCRPRGRPGPAQGSTFPALPPHFYLIADRYRVRGHSTGGGGPRWCRHRGVGRPAGRRRLPCPRGHPPRRQSAAASSADESSAAASSTSFSTSQSSPHSKSVVVRAAATYSATVRSQVLLTRTPSLLSREPPQVCRTSDV